MRQSTRCWQPGPSNEWRLIIALGRYAGLRCPSETLRLPWEDILWDTSRMVIHASKTQKQEHGGIRMVPIQPELLPYLERGFEEAKEGAQFVIARARDPKVNLRTLLIKILKRAGVKPWPRLFQNLRASCEVELTNKFPAHVVADWMGHTVRVANDHYLSTTEEHFTRAAQGAARTLHFPVPQEAVGKCKETQRATQPLERERLMRSLANLCSLMHECTVSSSGIEPDLRPSQSRVQPAHSEDIDQ